MAEEMKKFESKNNFIAQMIVSTRKQNLTWINSEIEELLTQTEGVKPIWKYYNQMSEYKIDILIP